MIANSIPPRAALAAALLLAAPVSGLAQAKPRAMAPTRTLAPAAPAPAAAKPAAPPFDERGPWRLGASIGWEWDTTPDSDLAGPRLQVELERDLVRLGRRGQLSFVAAGAWWHATDEERVDLGAGYVMTAEATANLLEVTPSFRASFSPLPRLRLFAELGAGGARVQGTIEVRTETPLGDFSAEETADDWAGVLRLAAGGTWAIDDRFRVGVQLPTFHWRFGEGKSRSFALSAVAAYAF